jgi:hypothetical protein
MFVSAVALLLVCGDYVVLYVFFVDVFCLFHLYRGSSRVWCPLDVRCVSHFFSHDEI